MIELVLADTCIGCDKCVEVCPTDVFDRTTSGIPEIAGQSDCQTCFTCEAYCPADALFVHPQTFPTSASDLVDEGQIGRYRESIGWGKGRAPGSLLAVGPDVVPPSTT
ncbi:4Fe-4S dicluster domain-containing protein [Rhodococcus sp. 27YEA15]|uniref:4Fe-4S dicluster domain-containing protein n=1 Tax=Rhodococcus sp. 27YEA15 TaxID=3156259 RepID=UPI003C7CB1D4